MKTLPMNICMMRSTYDHQLYISVLYIKVCNKFYNWIRTEILMLIQSGYVHEVFHDEVIFFTLATPFDFR